VDIIQTDLNDKWWLWLVLPSFTFTSFSATNPLPGLCQYNTYRSVDPQREHIQRCVKQMSTAGRSESLVGLTNVNGWKPATASNKLCWKADVQ